MRYLAQESPATTTIDIFARIGTIKAGETIIIIPRLAGNDSILGELRLIAQCEFSAVDQVEAFRKQHPDGDYLDLIAHLVARGCMEIVSCG